DYYCDSWDSTGTHDVF
nr:immunoglobulin light chain junction region [Macaca mulatta]MOW57369.1 immunoglobulin light chain junction region [Macaca mulatta]MOW57411.1 immunoglobulin light chain junction region [Macaca mulatta]MOW57486.1 immunoglobulin light chain junction region [Macaca mulatta]MOW57524.1 immunoglobulin light chain junction region [Macaca mulatta]